MSVVVTDAGEEAFLDLILAEDYTLRLYTTDVDAGLTSELKDELLAGDFTEATFAGYSAAALTGGAWTTAQSSPSVGTYAAQTFTRSSTGATETVYGYYVTRTTGGALRWYERFPEPIEVTANGDAIVVTPQLTLDDNSEGTVETGDIIATGSPTVGDGWLLCDGSAVSRTTYAALFAAIGEAYGAGDGSSTFNVPDLQGRFPMGVATSGTGADLGDTGGDIDHVHGLNTTSSGAKIFIAAADKYVRMFRKTVASWNTNNGAASNITVGASVTAETLATELIGDSDTANPPFCTVNFKIKT